MAKKNNNNSVENKNKNNDGGEKKKADGPIASKFVKWVKSVQGAESVKSEGQANKLTVVGKAKEAPLKTVVMKVDFQSQKCASRAVKIATSITGCNSVSVDVEKGLLTVTGSMDVVELVGRLRVRMAATILSTEKELVPLREKVGGNDDDGNNYEGNRGVGGGGDEKKKEDDGNNDEGNGGGSGDEKKKEEDEGNGGGKMKYPTGQYGFGQFSYRTVHRHEYGYQNGALKVGEKMLLKCLEVFDLLVMHNHLAKDIYTTSIHNRRVYFQECKAIFTFPTFRGCK